MWWATCSPHATKVVGGPLKKRAYDTHITNGKREIMSIE